MISNRQIKVNKGVYTLAFLFVFFAAPALASAGAVIKIQDPYWNNVSLLLGNDNKASSTSVFRDQSSFKQLITTVAGGIPLYDAAQIPPRLTSSLYFDGANDKLSVADAASLRLDGDFTIEWYWRPTNVTAGNYVTLLKSSPAAQSYIQLYNGNFYVKGDSGSYIWSALPAGMTDYTWHHFALTKSGTNWRVFTDGIQKGSTVASTTTFGNNSAAMEIPEVSLGAPYAGHMAGMRITKGVARYTANFTPPKLPLSSSVGGALGAVQSKSPPNSGLVSWWTFDSADTSGAYATWNPNDKSSDVTLSNGNLTVSTGVGVRRSVRATTGKSSGKWYWETTIIGISSNTDPIVGIGRASASLTNGPGGDANGWGYWNDGQVWTGGSNGAYGAAWVAGDIISVALDMDAGTITFYKNGVSQGQAFSGITGTIYPMQGVLTTASATTNFGATAFAYAPPAGYKVLAPTTFDRSGQGNTGTLVGSPTKVAGKAGQALSFNGTSSYVDSGTAGSLNNLSAITVSAWIKTNTISNDKTIVSKYDSGINAGITLQTGGGGYGGGDDIAFSINGSNFVYTNNNIVIPGTWMYVVGIFDNSLGTNKHKIYINGVSVAVTNYGSPDAITSTGASTQNLNIGRSAFFGRYWNGSIDGVRIYNRALSAAEVAAIYNANVSSQASVAKTNTSQNSRVTNGLVGLWSFDGPDMAGVTAYDRSGQGNNGTLPALTFVAAASDNGTGSLTYPGGATTGDLMVLFINFGTTGATTPSGWTLQGSTYLSPTNSYTYGIYTKIKAADTSVTYTTQSGGAHILVYRGASGIGTIGSWSETANGATVTLLGITPQVANSLVVGYASDRDPGSCSVSAGWSSRIADNFTYFCNVAGDRAFNSTSPTGNQTWNAQNGSQVAVGVLMEVKSASNDPPFRTIGKLGQALNFNGSSGYVDIGSASSLMPTTALTVSAWVKTSSSITNFKSILVSPETSSDGGGYGLLGINTNKISFYLDLTGSNVWVNADTTTTLSQGKWYHITGAWDGSNIRMYVNGVLESTTVAGSIGYGTTVKNAEIGRYRSYGNFPGSIDNVRIYNRALTASEIKLLYNLGK